MEPTEDIAPLNMNQEQTQKANFEPENRQPTRKSFGCKEQV